MAVACARKVFVRCATRIYTANWTEAVIERHHLVPPDVEQPDTGCHQTWTVALPRSDDDRPGRLALEMLKALEVILKCEALNLSCDQEKVCTSGLLD